ncbi:MAG: AarF/ABC1/UbiB kinase family protein [Myxococcales bacterium]|nr:AarF/ABC1/UbiB kinase family protein [Myxococcales bacterium]MCB9668585.1 AarF/ABC1/UbiB kinase family protein [Alphaproteobacteria bacterium]MCB9690825.1 AarF/ABC1/UbiB kinase family protein [Alphaproteobacteria bacterium]
MSKPSRLSRLAKLGSLTGRVTSSVIGGRVRDAFRSEEVRKKAREKLQLDNAREIVATVGKMKGAAMKLGQQIAIAAEALDLPDDVRETLGRLNNQGEPVPFEQIRADIEAELEGPLETLFARFDEVPLGTASLGQAHTAALADGTEVVVKVLHRGVEQSVETDLLALKAMLLSSRAMRRPKAEVDGIFEEIKARLSEELDYLQEAANIQTFQRLFEGEAWVRIPRLHPRWCTERVLTMDRLQGVHIDRFRDEGSQEARQRAAEGLAELYYRQIFRFRVLHADPHPGNFLFEPDGTIGLVDFGCVKRLDEFWMGTYARCAMAIHADDREAAMAASRDMGAWDGEDAEGGEALWSYLRALGAGFRMGPIVLGADDEKLVEPITRAGRKLPLYRSVTLPPEVLFLHRSLGGLYTLSRSLNARVDYGSIAMRYAAEAVEAARG